MVGKRQILLGAGVDILALRVEALLVPICPVPLLADDDAAPEVARLSRADGLLQAPVVSIVKSLRSLALVSAPSFYRNQCYRVILIDHKCPELASMAHQTTLNLGCWFSPANPGNSNLPPASD